MKQKNDDLGVRMKKYEHIYRNYLSPRQYYILRIDGKAFSSYTKGLKRPFDEGLMADMAWTTKYLCSEIQGAQFGYTQSDEITIVFTDLMGLNSDIWFGGNIQKIVSVAASLATSKFNELRINRALSQFAYETVINGGESYAEDIDDIKLANFDARLFSMSQRYEVLNNILWRQQDASKNSVQMLARSLFSHKECQNKNGSELQDMMMLERKTNWNDLDTPKKRGYAVYKVSYKEAEVNRSKWIVDEDIPIFSKDWTWFDGKII